MKYKFAAAALSAAVLLSPAQTASPAVVSPDSTTVYGADGTFAKGLLVNLTAVDGTLRLNRATKPLPLLNVAASKRGTLVRVDTASGEIVGEYLTAPKAILTGSDGEAWPSVTAVDLFGNVWVGNEADNVPVDGVEKGAVTRIGLVLGGVRGDRTGTGPAHGFTPNPEGQYLKPPFVYNTCIDRDGDGLIRTSRGLGDVGAWENPGGVDTGGGVSSAEDEAIINYVRVSGTRVGALAVDRKNDLWAGGRANRTHERLDGMSGSPVEGTQFRVPNAGGHGAVIDGFGVLWSASGAAGTNRPVLLRWNPRTRISTTWTHYGGYGVTVDPRSQGILTASPDYTYVSAYMNGGFWLANLAHGSAKAAGLAIDNDGDVWVTHVNGTMGRISSMGWVGDVSLGTSETATARPAGAAIDAEGKVWVPIPERNEVMRIDPSLGAMGLGGAPIGQTDLTVNLGDGSGHPAPNQQAAGPYAHGDMTGHVLLSSTFNSGSWTFVHDGGGPDKAWGMISWTGSTPGGVNPPTALPRTSIGVEVRAADRISSLPGSPARARGFKLIKNGEAFGGVRGQFLEVRVTLARDVLVSETPSLSELRIASPTLETDPPELKLQASVEPADGLLRVEFEGMAGKRYRVFSSPDLLNWEEVPGEPMISKTGGPVVWEAEMGQAGFFRVGVE